MAKQKRIYRAHPNAAYSDKEAQWIGIQLEKHGGNLTPRQFVELCRPAKSPGHKLFIWDDAKAAEEYRLERARYHLRTLHIEIIHDGDKQPIRACFPVYQEDREVGQERSYVSYDKVREAPDLARQVVEKAAHELKTWRARYALYKSVFGSVFTAISEVEKELWPQQNQSTGLKTKSRSTAAPRKAK